MCGLCLGMECYSLRYKLVEEETGRPELKASLEHMRPFQNLSPCPERGKSTEWNSECGLLLHVQWESLPDAVLFHLFKYELSLFGFDFFFFFKAGFHSVTLAGLELPM